MMMNAQDDDGLCLDYPYSLLGIIIHNTFSVFSFFFFFLLSRVSFPSVWEPIMWHCYTKGIHSWCHSPWKKSGYGASSVNNGHAFTIINICFFIQRMKTYCRRVSRRGRNTMTLMHRCNKGHGGTTSCLTGVPCLGRVSSPSGRILLSESH